MARSAWTTNDRKFLRSLRIRSDDPPLQERFIAVEGLGGVWYVIDTELGRKRVRTCRPGHPAAETRAIDAAAQLNRSDVVK